ncbi:MAG: glycosyltransferase family 4 protein, partial [Candidatus Omnitrophica bacterium]|nr:glycosyltransferase family 4 protein [Candidatus Omnitrophota bacterium]
GRYILTVGRFVPEKGYHDLVAAFARLQDAGEVNRSTVSSQRSDCGLAAAGGWKLVIVGDADHEDDYSRKLKSDAAATPGVILTGRLTGLPLQEIYSNAGLFVLPSYYEGLPIVLLEAMSYGLNCIVSDIPANREVALSAERYFQPGDIDGMAAKMAEFVQRPLSVRERAQQLELIAREYDWGVIARKTLDVYTELLAACSRRS